MDLQTLKEAIAGLDFKNHADIRAAAALPKILESLSSFIPDTPSFARASGDTPLSAAEEAAIVAAPMVKVRNVFLPKLNCLTDLQIAAIYDEVNSTVSQDSISIQFCFGSLVWDTTRGMFTEADIFAIYRDEDSGALYSYQIEI